jgi:6-methylsalicylate decarboxylase
MSKTYTSHTILSLTAPGVQVVPLPEQPALARSVNEYAAQLCSQNPEKFSFFAALPSLFSTEACLAEIAYALDVLKADGVTLFTRYGDGNNYLGHPAFRSIWIELNARKAVVFIHPTHAATHDMINPLLPLPFLDYPHETARTAMDMLVTHTKRATPPAASSSLMRAAPSRSCSSTQPRASK